jgi:hypothetical protein
MFSDKQRYDTIKNKFNNTFHSKLLSSSSLKKETDDENDAGSTLLQRNINLIPNQSINIEETEDFKIIKHIYNYSPEIINNGIPKMKNDEIVFLCVYNIDTSSVLPFIKFLLYKNTNENQSDEELFLPYFKYSQKESILTQSDEKIKLIFSEWKNTPEYKGYITHDDKIYLIYEKPYEKANVLFKKRNDKWWWCLSSELIDSRKIMNFPIQKNTSLFFFHNNKLLYLYDKHNQPYENPISGYHGSYYKMTNFITIFGLNKASPTSALGPYYYFASYKKALSFAIWTPNRSSLKIDNKLITIDNEGKYEKGGIVRFALFTGKMKVFMNNERDEDDNSKTTHILKKKDPYVKQTLKLRDVNGKWTDEHNSAFIGINKIDMGEKSTWTQPYIVVKNYNQQIPISYHYIDTKDTDIRKKLLDESVFIE